MSMRPSDACALLSVAPDASPDTIRRAYKRLCLRWHPDKHPAGPSRHAAEAKFKAVALAYSVLVDNPSSPNSESCENKAPPDPFADAGYRRRFADGFAQQCRADGFSVDADMLFDSLFGERRAEFDAKMTAGRLDDKVVELAVTLEELTSGCVKKRRVRNEGKNPVVLSVVVRPGYRAGDRVRFRDAIVEDDIEGDLVFVIALKEHERLTMKGDDVWMKARVKLVDALAGVAMCVKGADGKDVRVRIDGVMEPGYVHRVSGHGMPRRGKADEKGDLCIEFEIEFPKKIEADDRRAVRDLFARLERSAAMKMNMRRSSSLFMNRGVGMGGLGGMGGGVGGGARRSSVVGVGMDTGIDKEDKGEEESGDTEKKGGGRGKATIRSKLSHMFR